MYSLFSSNINKIILCYNLHKLHIKEIGMAFVIKYFYMILFVIVFLVSSIVDYFQKDNWSLFQNLLYAFWIVIFLAMARLLLKSKQVATKKMKKTSR